MVRWRHSRHHSRYPGCSGLTRLTFTGASRFCAWKYCQKATSGLETRARAALNLPRAYWRCLDNRVSRPWQIEARLLEMKLTDRRNLSVEGTTRPGFSAFSAGDGESLIRSPPVRCPIPPRFGSIRHPSLTLPGRTRFFTVMESKPTPFGGLLLSSDAHQRSGSAFGQGTFC